MSTLPILSAAPRLATDCLLAGTGRRADCVWTRDEFMKLCGHMMNGNAPSDFMLIYRDARRDNRPCFAKAKKAVAHRRASWAWDTITGRAKSKAGIGFYPTNAEEKTRWGAMDFDAHDGNALRARGFALAAFNVLNRQAELFVVLGTSGSEGWHLFAFTRDLHPIAEWTRLLKDVAALISAEVRDGICEVFPNEPKPGSRPYGIRAPGTWNPKSDEFGLIVSNSLTPLLAEGEKERKSNPFLYHANNRVKETELHDRYETSLYRGKTGEWKEQFAIIHSGSRHAQLNDLVNHIFHQVGHAVARRNAEAQYHEANPRPKTAFTDAMEDFEELWNWAMERWLAELSERERHQFIELQTENQRDTFRIAHSFWREARRGGEPDFPFSVESVARRLGISWQGICKIRTRFVELEIIAQTAPCRPNSRAARYRWITHVEQPF